jgi:hypothetical protein
VLAARLAVPWTCAGQDRTPDDVAFGFPSLEKHLREPARAERQAAPEIVTCRCVVRRVPGMEGATKVSACGPALGQVLGSFRAWRQYTAPTRFRQYFPPMFKKPTSFFIHPGGATEQEICKWIVLLRVERVAQWGRSISSHAHSMRAPVISSRAQRRRLIHSIGT